MPRNWISPGTSGGWVACGSSGVVTRTSIPGSGTPLRVSRSSPGASRGVTVIMPAPSVMPKSVSSTAVAGTSLEMTRWVSAGATLRMVRTKPSRPGRIPGCGAGPG